MNSAKHYFKDPIKKCYQKSIIYFEFQFNFKKIVLLSSKTNQCLCYVLLLHWLREWELSLSPVDNKEIH